MSKRAKRAFAAAMALSMTMSCMPLTSMAAFFDFYTDRNDPNPYKVQCDTQTYALPTKDELGMVQMDNLVPAGKELSGWEIDGKTYDPGHIYTIGKDTSVYSVYAVWSDTTIVPPPNIPMMVTVTFNYNNGTPSQSINIERGTTIAKPTDPSNGNKTFGGWYTDVELTNKYDFTAPVTEDIILYAKWNSSVAIVVPSVYFDPNGGIGTGFSIESDPAAFRPSITLPSCTFTAPDGKIFVGWSSTPDGSTGIAPSGLTLELPYDKITLYACWIDDPNQKPETPGEPCDINFYWSAEDSKPFRSYSINYNTSYMDSEYPIPTPRHAELENRYDYYGKYFTGWYADPDLKEKFNFRTALKANTSVYAGWSDAEYTENEIELTSLSYHFISEDGVSGDDVTLDPAELKKTGTYTQEYTVKLTSKPADGTDIQLGGTTMSLGNYYYTSSFYKGEVTLILTVGKWTAVDGASEFAPLMDYIVHFVTDENQKPDDDDSNKPGDDDSNKPENSEKPSKPNKPSKPDYDDDDRDYVDMTGGNSGSSGGSGSSSTTTEKNPDGSTTTTKTDKNGTTVENTKRPDGSSVQVKTEKDGTVTTTEKDAKGNQTQTVEKADGSKEFTATQKDGTKAEASVDTAGTVTANVDVSKKAVQEASSQGQAVQLPIPAVSSEKGGKASTVTVDLPKDSGKVDVVIPVAEVTPGTVAVIVYPDGTEKVVIQTKLTEAGLGLTLEGGATLKIVDNSKSFDDVKPTDWFNNATDFVSSRNLFAGTSETEFSPNAPMTMEMLFAVAHNFMGQPETTASGVAGAKPEDWFHTASNWAAEMGLTSGLKMDMLGSNQPISREDTAILLFNLSGKAASYIPSAETLAKLNAFTDIADMDPANRTALAWAVENGIMNGMGDGTFGFKGNNTRAQTGAVMMNFNNNL